MSSVFLFGFLSAFFPSKLKNAADIRFDYIRKIKKMPPGGGGSNRLSSVISFKNMFPLFCSLQD